jgi:hypothetical protein
MNNKWLCINEELAYKKIRVVKCINKAHIVKHMRSALIVA